MPEYTVTIIAEARGYITVEAANEDEARAKGDEIGMEIANVAELSDFSVHEVEHFQG